MARRSRLVISQADFLKLKLGFGFQIGKKRGKESFPSALSHFSPSLRWSCFWRGGWQEPSAPRPAAAPGRVDADSSAGLAATRGAQRTPCLPRPRLHLQQQVREQPPCAPRVLRRSPVAPDARSTTPSRGLPSPGDADIRARPAAPRVPFAHRRSASRSRPWASPGPLVLSPAIGSGQRLHSPPPSLLPLHPPSAPIGLAAPRAALTWPAEWGWLPKAARPRRRSGQPGLRSSVENTLQWPSLMDCSGSQAPKLTGVRAGTSEPGLGRRGLGELRGSRFLVFYSSTELSSLSP